MDAQRPHLVNVPGAAEYLSTTERHIRSLIHTRRIPFMRCGGLIRFRTTELDSWLDEHAVPEGGAAA